MLAHAALASGKLRLFHQHGGYAFVMVFTEVLDSKPGFLRAIVVEIDRGLLVTVFAQNRDLFTWIDAIDFRRRPLVRPWTRLLPGRCRDILLVIEKCQQGFFLMGQTNAGAGKFNVILEVRH